METPTDPAINAIRRATQQLRAALDEHEALLAAHRHLRSGATWWTSEARGANRGDLAAS